MYIMTEKSSRKPEREESVSNMRSCLWSSVWVSQCVTSLSLVLGVDTRASTGEAIQATGSTNGGHTSARLQASSLSAALCSATSHLLHNPTAVGFGFGRDLDRMKVR